MTVRLNSGESKAGSFYLVCLFPPGPLCRSLSRLMPRSLPRAVHSAVLIARSIFGAHPKHREKMAIRAGHPQSRTARSDYEVLTRFDGFATLRVLPRTGRTHQIRVHLAHIGCPIVCDRLYAGHSTITRSEISCGKDNREVLLTRQALHARQITFQHPLTNARVSFAAPVPDDMGRLLRALEKFRTP